MKLTKLILAILASTALMAQAATTAAPSSSSSTSNSAATATGGETVLKVQPAKKWGAMYYNLISVKSADVNTGDFEDTKIADAFVRLSYKLDSNQYVQFRQYWKSSLQDDPEIKDFAFVYGQKSIGKALGGNLSASTRLYVPVSDYSQEVGAYQLRGYITFSQKHGGKLSSSYNFSPRFYGYTKDEAGQTGLTTVTWADLTYSLTDAFSVNTGLTYITVHRQSGNKLQADGTRLIKGKPANSAANFDELDVSIGASYDVSSNFSVTGSLIHERDVRATNAYTLFNDDETIYYFELIAHM